MVCSFPCPMDSVDLSLLLWFVCNKIEAISFLIVSSSSSYRCSYFIKQLDHSFLPHPSYTYDTFELFFYKNWRSIGMDKSCSLVMKSKNCQR